MNKLIALVAFAALVAGCATTLKEPNPTAFAGYGPAMAHHDGYQMAYEWQQANPDLVKKATEPQVLAPFVASDDAADALLAKIGTAYDGDPIALTQIAAVTQLVMCPRCSKAPAARKIWVAALKRAQAGSDDDYVKTFCAQQLRLCDYRK